jgi:hypothetical protein
MNWAMVASWSLLTWNVSLAAWTLLAQVKAVRA